MQDVPPAVDTTKAHPARMYDYFLGGKDNFAVDRRTAETAMESWPTVVVAARANRAFLVRAVRHLAREAGIRQFLDVGTGLPSVNSVHEVAQAQAPDCRIVYVDNDPIVLVHAQSLLQGTPEGQLAYIDGDLREPEKILAAPATRLALDFERPVAVLLLAVLHFLEDDEDPRRIVETFLEAIPSGSHLVASHITADFDPEGVNGLVRTYNEAGIRGQARTAREFSELAFGGMEILDPGVVLLPEWRPDDDGPRPSPAEVSAYGGVARKP
jgi:hypothetical protein